MIERNVKLKAAIFESGHTSREIAEKAGIHPSFLSMATTGRYILDDRQKARVAKVLGKKTKDLFK